MADKPTIRDRAAFWDRRIRQWSETSYADRRQTLMARLRTSIDHRKDEAKAQLTRHLGEGFVVLDLGCGIGRFGLELVKEGKAAKAIGVDFSPKAIQTAERLRDEMGIPAQKAPFRVATTDEPLDPEADVVTGLGLLDWLDDDQVESLFARLEGRRFLFSYSEQDWSIAEIVHRLYLVYRLRLTTARVRAYHHRRSVMVGLAEKHGLGPVEIVSAPGMRFGRLIHNLGRKPD